MFKWSKIEVNYCFLRTGELLEEAWYYVGTRGRYQMDNNPASQGPPLLTLCRQARLGTSKQEQPYVLARETKATVLSRHAHEYLYNHYFSSSSPREKDGILSTKI